jgi:phosphoglycerate dehydrogenase-like enzyme
VCYTAGALPSPPGVGNASMMELTIGMMLAAMREFAEQDRELRAGGWPGPHGRVLHGKTLGIVGLGRLGTQVAQAAQFFGMRVLAAGLSLTPERAAAAGVEFRSLEQLFSESDVVSIHLRLSDRSRGLINRSLLGRMKRDAILVNTARGPIVDREALATALSTGQIAGAALDVTSPEPLPADDPLWQAPNLLVVPHIGSATWSARERMTEIAVENILAGLEGRQLPYQVPSQLFG